MSYRHGPFCNCGCAKPVREVVHPVKHNVVHRHTKEIVKHVHPSHTTVMNHHLVKNKHVFPHSTSVKNTYNEVDVFGRPGRPVAGAMSPGGYPGQVAGAMGQGYPGMGYGHGHGMHCKCKKCSRW